MNPEDVICLSAPEDLLALAENCISDVWSREKVVVLKNDINMSGIPFTGIPTFGGTFLGQGFTIFGLRLTIEQSAQGFFRYLQKTAVVEDLHLKGTVQPVRSGNLDIGGIAGSSERYIVDSFSRSILAGGTYVGGIAGFGREVAGCYAVTDIADATKCAGGILGYTDPLPDEGTGLIQGNRYYLTGANFGGIDGICYDGATAPMTIREFLAVENLDEMFRKVTIRFVAEGQEDVVLTVALGDSVGLEKIPQPETVNDELYHWVLENGVTSRKLGMGEVSQVQYISKERLTDILFDQTYRAVFDSKNTVIASEEKTEAGRTLALAVGAFDQGTTLTLTNIMEQETTVHGVAVQENWQVTMSDIGIERLHYHIPGDVEAEQIVLYIEDYFGNWVQRDFAVEGAYMIFDFDYGESGFALAVKPAKKFPVVTVAIAAGALVILLVVIRIVRKRKAKRSVTRTGR